jgi:hypothetical protein
LNKINLYQGRYRVVQGLNKLLITFSLLLAMHYANAYQFTSDFKMGYFWMNFPIYFTVNPANVDDEVFRMTEDALSDAIETWYSSASNPIRVWEFVPWEQAQGNGSIQVVRWSNNFSGETGYSALGTMAVTVRQSTVPYIRKSEIIINTSHSSLRMQDNLSLVLIHELGHTIGLDHSNQAGALMYASLSFGPMGNRELTQDDVDGYNAVVAENINRQRYGSALSQQSDSIPFLPSCSGSSAVTVENLEQIAWTETILNFLYFILSTALMILIILGAGKIFTLFETNKVELQDVAKSADEQP